MAISFGLQTNSQVFVCSETVEAESILIMKHDANHTEILDRTLINITGDQADKMRLMSLAVENAKLFSLKFKVDPSPSLIAGIIAERMHGALRESPMKCQSIVGGMKKSGEFELFGVDGHGALHKDNFIVSGYGLYFLFGVFDLYFKPDMNEEEAMVLIKACLKTLSEKMILNTSRWRLDIVDSNGFRDILI